MKSLSLRIFASVPTNGTADNSVQLAGYKHCRKVDSLAGIGKIDRDCAPWSQRKSGWVGILLNSPHSFKPKSIEESWGKSRSLRNVTFEELFQSRPDLDPTRPIFCRDNIPLGISCPMLLPGSRPGQRLHLQSQHEFLKSTCCPRLDSNETIVLKNVCRTSYKIQRSVRNWNS